MRNAKKQKVSLLFLGLFLLLSVRWLAGAGLEADLVIYNGKILTADNPDPNRFTVAQAAAIYDGKFVAVGSNDEALQYAGANTRKIDLGGRTVLPGLIETHDHIYGYSSHFFPPDAPRIARTDPSVRFTNKAEFLNQIRTLVLKKKPGEWVITSPQGGIIPELQRGEVTRFDLDQIAPNNPVYIHWNVLVDGLANTKALQPLLDRYPDIPGLLRDARGIPTGQLAGVANPTMQYEFMPKVPPELLGPYYKMEMEEIAAQGLTTVSSRLAPNELSAFAWLQARREMPLRFAYTLETMARSETTEAIASRLVGLQGGSGKDIWGAGDNWLWIIGVTPDSLDATIGPGGACVRKPYPREAPNFPLWRFQFYGPNGICRLKDPNYHDIDVVRMAAKYGFRISGMHVGGDMAFDHFMDAIEQESTQYPDIAGRRWAIDHCQIVHEDQIQRAKKFNIMFSCAPKYLYGGEKGGVGGSKVLYGEEAAANAVIPMRSLIDNGLRTVMELDQHAFHPFLAVQIVVTRKDMEGKVWGLKQRISRQEALYAYTRWSAEYVLKEDVLGSIELRKLADFVVLDRDYLTAPEDEIGRIDPVLTVVEGKLVYTQPAFASSQGLPVVGYQGDRSRWLRGTPEDARRGGGGGE